MEPVFATSQDNTPENSSQQKIRRSAHDKENPFAQISKELLQNTCLSFRARGLMCYMLSFPNTWEAHPKHIAKENGIGRDQIYIILNELIEAGYCKFNQPKDSKSRYSCGWYEFSENPIFKKNIPHPEKAYPEKADHTNNVVYNNNDTQGIDLSETLPESLPSIEGVKLTGKQKFPLRKDQQQIFREMKALNLGCPDEKLVILIRKYWYKGAQFLKDCIHHMYYQIISGVTFAKEKIAFFTHCLNGKQALVTKKCIENMHKAKEICEHFKWFDLKITEKYVQCTKTLKEIGTNLDPRDFVQALENIYYLSRG